MPETPFPSPEELQKKIQEFMKANFGEHVAVSAFTQQSATDEPPEERVVQGYAMSKTKSTTGGTETLPPGVKKHEHFKREHPVVVADIKGFARGHVFPTGDIASEIVLIKAL